jgi:hypothetical protein
MSVINKVMGADRIELNEPCIIHKNIFLFTYENIYLNSTSYVQCLFVYIVHLFVLNGAWATGSKVYVNDMVEVSLNSFIVRYHPNFRKVTSYT